MSLLLSFISVSRVDVISTANKQPAFQTTRQTLSSDGVTLSTTSLRAAISAVATVMQRLPQPPHQGVTWAEMSSPADGIRQTDGVNMLPPSNSDVVKNQDRSSVGVEKHVRDSSIAGTLPLLKSGAELAVDPFLVNLIQPKKRQTQSKPVASLT